MFNRMLLNLCIKNQCSYINVFNYFVDPVYGYDYNIYLYKDSLHLNHKGVVQLAYYLRYVINRDRHNPMIF